MGLFNKLKNVLFEEEEVEETLTEEPQEEKLEVNNKIEPLVEEVSEYKPLPEQKPEFVKPKQPLFIEEEDNNFSERELFRSESTFKFPAFDEEEFNTSMPHLKEEEKKSNNVLDFERRQKQERRNEYSRIDRDSSEDNKAREEIKRFKPSPVISPVYGILDKDYKKEDIVNVPKDKDNGVITSKDLDVESVRAKAFGKLNSSLNNAEKKSLKEKVVTETYNIKKEEEPKKVEEEVKIDDVIITSEPIIDDSAKLREERSKTIDELLKDASDEVIDVTDDVTEAIDDVDLEDLTTPDYEKIESEIDDALDSVIDEIPEDLPEEKEIEEIKEEVKEEKNPLDSDTLESDLYDLIDSMYDNTEDGE